MPYDPANSTSGLRRAPAIDGGALDAVAAHCRAAGTCFVLVATDGALLYHDAHAPPIYGQYAVPALLGDESLRCELTRRCRALAETGKPGASEEGNRAAVPSAAPQQVWDFVPGVLLCASPYVERRRTLAICILVGKREDFRPSDDVVCACGHLGLNPAWLDAQAAGIIAHGPQRLMIGMGLAQTILSDRLRVLALEGELRSLSNQLANTYEELSLIDQISGGMRVNRSRADFFQQACIEVMEVVGVRAMGVALDPDKRGPEPVLFGDLTLPRDLLLDLSTQILQTLRQRKSALLINAVAEDRDYRWLQPHVKQLIAVPLQRGDQVLGCLLGIDKVRGDFDSVDSKLLTSIANASAIYLQNALLFGDLHDLMMGLLRSLTSAVDAKDAYTCGHTERVAVLSRHLAVQIGLSDTEVERVYMAGLLHDVGKIGVPESVLQKAGRLTPEEYALMKKHPQIGARILADVKQLGDVVPGVLHHHERYDGGGYPAGLAAQGIPLMGRIICLADGFDAMTSNRTYRNALSLEVALNEIRRCSGTQFDPALAEVFLHITPDAFVSLLREHQTSARRLLDLQETLRAA